MKYGHVLISACVLAAATSCSKPNPAAQCGMDETRQAYLNSILSAVSAAKERDENSIWDADALKRAREMFAALKKANLLSFGQITAEHYDPATGNIDCYVEIKPKPTGEFSTQSVQDQAAQMEEARKTAIFPPGFFNGRATSMPVIFNLRRNAEGKQIVLGGAGFQQVVDLAGELMSARALSDAVMAANHWTNPNWKAINPATQALPTDGQCFATQIHEVTGRLAGDLSSGTTVTFEDGHIIVDYSVSKTASLWNSGDPVKLCVVKLPANCPDGDNRGVTYRAINLRTGNDWTAPDSEHECGGA